uniref:Uncharacterized protein n=1 Tax=Anguilla anguilla TaxID=7936 RepID=A0A0E9VPU4_ANGAN
MFAFPCESKPRFPRLLHNICLLTKTL